MHPLQLEREGEGGGDKNFRKILLGGGVGNFHFGGGGGDMGGGSRNFEVKIKTA